MIMHSCASEYEGECSREPGATRGTRGWSGEQACCTLYNDGWGDAQATGLHPRCSVLMSKGSI